MTLTKSFGDLLLGHTGLQRMPIKPGQQIGMFVMPHIIKARQAYLTNHASIKHSGVSGALTPTCSCLD